MTKEEALKILDTIPTIGEQVDALEMAIKALEQPERKKGKWIRITKGEIPEMYMCPFCHKTIEYDGVEAMVPLFYPFCHCGADMRGAEAEE